MSTIFRKSKIARLPRTLRDELNQRIDNGVPGPHLLAWLNADPAVKEVLAQYFQGCPLTKQNLSDWRHGGYEDWAQLQEKRSLTLQALEHAETFDVNLNPEKVNAALATITAVESLHTSQTKLKACKDIDERWECLGEIQNRLCRARREDFRVGNLALRREKWNYHVEEQKSAADQAAETEQRRHMLTYFDLQPELLKLGQQNCGHEKAYDRAVFILELRHNLPVGFLDEKPPTLYPPNSEGRVPRVPNISPSPSSAPTIHESINPLTKVPIAPVGDSRSPQHAVEAQSQSPTPSNPQSAIQNPQLPPTPEEFAARNRSTVPTVPQSASRRCPSNRSPLQPDGHRSSADHPDATPGTSSQIQPSPGSEK